MDGDGVDMRQYLGNLWIESSLSGIVMQAIPIHTSSGIVMQAIHACKLGPPADQRCPCTAGAIPKQVTTPLPPIKTAPSQPPFQHRLHEGSQHPESLLHAPRPVALVVLADKIVAWPCSQGKGGYVGYFDLKDAL